MDLLDYGHGDDTAVSDLPLFSPVRATNRARGCQDKKYGLARSRDHHLYALCSLSLHMI